MKIIFPVCYLDLDRLDCLLDNILYFDQKITAPVLLVYKEIESFPVDKIKINNIIQKIKNIFGNCNFFTFKENIKLKWELSVSNTFANVVRYLEKLNNNDPFYFFEADNTIIKKGWYNKIAEEYYSLESPYLCLGIVTKVSKFYKDKYGELTLVGGAIYPKNISKYIQNFINQNFEDSNIEDYFKSPFDLCISKDILKISKRSKYIQSTWKCDSFLIKENEVVFNKKGTEKKFKANPELYIFHGCKDNSLIKIVQQREIC